MRGIRQLAGRLCLAMTIVFGGGPATMPEGSDRQVLMRIYFVPFSIETYVPVTMDNIEDKALHVLWFTKEHPLLQKLHGALTRSVSTRKIDEKVIRLKVEVGDETFFVDKDGIVFSKSTSNSYSLTKKQQGQIETSIMYFSGVIDVKASRQVLGSES